jgi:hypothetical protein
MKLLLLKASVVKVISNKSDSIDSLDFLTQKFPDKKHIATKIQVMLVLFRLQHWRVTSLWQSSGRDVSQIWRFREGWDGYEVTEVTGISMYPKIVDPGCVLMF